MICPRQDSCLFYNQKILKNRFYQALVEKYCEDKYTNCARYIIAKSLGAENVPDDLNPATKDMADKVIKIHKLNDDNKNTG